MSNALEIRTAVGGKDGLTLFIEVYGRVDAGGARQLGVCLENNKPKEPNGRMVVDLTHVTELVSAGLRVLLDLRSKAQDPRRIALVCRSDGMVWSLLTLTGLARLLFVFSDRESCQRAWEAN
jgi:anti-anti-sigma factor